MSLTAVVPARYASTRFPGKPLAQLLGKPMVQHVWERCHEAKVFSRVVVATDDERIAQAARSFGAEVALTSTDCVSGTDRVAQVARSDERGDDAAYVNVQGDEPAVHPDALRTLAMLITQPHVVMATLRRPLLAHERTNPNVVKVVVNASDEALYFSRADIPFSRDPSVDVARWAHVGLYAYRRRTLLELSSFPESPLERSEGLEQLRALHQGVRITCGLSTHASVSVDSPADVPLAEAALTKWLKSDRR